MSSRGCGRVLFHQRFEVDRILWAGGLNLVYLLLGAAAFLWAFRAARERGLLQQSGE